MCGDWECKVSITQLLHNRKVYRSLSLQTELSASLDILLYLHFSCWYNFMSKEQLSPGETCSFVFEYNPCCSGWSCSWTQSQNEPIVFSLFLCRHCVFPSHLTEQIKAWIAVTVFCFTIIPPFPRLLLPKKKLLSLLSANDATTLLKSFILCIYKRKMQNNIVILRKLTRNVQLWICDKPTTEAFGLD